MKKITWFGVAQSPYNDYLFSEFAKVFDLTVFYKIKRKKTHPWKLNSAKYPLHYLQGNLFRAIKLAKSSEVIVVSGWSFWQHITLMLIPMAGVRKIYWTDTPNLEVKEWSGVKGNLRRLLVKLVFKVFDEVWSTGKPGCDALEKLGCSKSKIKSFPFFLDLSRYAILDDQRSDKAKMFASKYIRSEQDVIFLCMGQIASKKRFGDAIKALSIVNSQEAVLWIAGTGPQLEELKLLAQELQVDKQVFFLGWLQQSEVELAYIAANVFVHPADFDPFPTVVLDAMTWGKPIIGTDVSGSVIDRVKSGANGFIYSPGEIEDLAKYMLYFLRNRPEIQQYGAEARKMACKYPVQIAVDRFTVLANSYA